MTVSTAIRWPAAATTPRAPLRAGFARVVFDHAVRRVRVRVTYPDGRVLGAGSPASPELAVVRPAAFLARLGCDAKIGFGEAYMAGDWRAGSGTDLADLLTSVRRAADHADSSGPAAAACLRRPARPP